MFRLQNLSEIRKTINEERRKRTDLGKKCRKSVKVVAIVDNVLAGFTIILGSVSRYHSAFYSSRNVSSYNCNRSNSSDNRDHKSSWQSSKQKVMKKVEKHEKIRVLIKSTLSTISGYVSKALNDEKITDDEYSLIVSEHDKFREMKENIRAKVKPSVENRIKNLKLCLKSLASTLTLSYFNVV